MRGQRREGVSITARSPVITYVLAAGDFMATPAVEATIHQLDMLADDSLVGQTAEGLAAAGGPWTACSVNPPPLEMMPRMPF